MTSFPATFNIAMFTDTRAVLRPPEFFETASLLARKPREDDAPAAFAAYASDPRATRYLAWLPYSDVAKLAEFLRGRAAGWERGDGHYAYMLCARGTDTPIGSIGLFINEPKAMFGYVLGQPYWGRGYATEALSWLVGWTDGQQRIRRVWAYCAADNRSSARVMEKAGLRCQGVRRRAQIFPNLGPEPRDCVYYAKAK